MKHERGWFSRNESIAGVIVVEGGAESAHSRTGGGAEWAGNMPNKCSSVKWSVAEGARRELARAFRQTYTIFTEATIGQ